MILFFILLLCIEICYIVFNQDILLYIHNFLSPDDVDLIIYLFFIANTTLIIYMIMYRAIPNFLEKYKSLCAKLCFEIGFIVCYPFAIDMYMSILVLCALAYNAFDIIRDIIAIMRKSKNTNTRETVSQQQVVNINTKEKSYICDDCKVMTAEDFTRYAEKHSLRYTKDNDLRDF